MRTYRKQIVIIGGGFGGLHVARGLRSVDADVTLIDKQNHHLFQALLYQVAMAGLSPRDIAAPLRGILRNQKNTRVIMDEVTGIDTTARTLALREGESIAYDYLVVAAGATNSYFGNKQWEENTQGLKTLTDALEMRRRVLDAFEQAERTNDVGEQAKWLTFVVVGSGPTGVELAGALAELAHLTMRKNFRNINPENTKVILVDYADRVLPPYSPDLSAKAEVSLRKLGVTVETGARVIDIERESITVEQKGAQRTIETRNILWAAGVQASPLAKFVAAATDAPTDRTGRLIVNADMSLPGHPEILAIGDIANYAFDRGKPTAQPLPGLAPVAMQQGDYAAKVLKARIQGSAVPDFHYVDKGILATIGRNAAVGTVFGVKLTGYIAWLAWLFVHLMYLVGFDSRVLVFFQWMWNYLTFARGSRLIIDHAPQEKIDAPKKAVRNPGITASVLVGD